MREIHREMNELQATGDALSAIAERTARRYRLIHDEFHVSDIADAMTSAPLEKVMDLGAVRDDQQFPPGQAVPERAAARPSCRRSNC
jgi:hypothetical protein